MKRLWNFLKKLFCRKLDTKPVHFTMEAPKPRSTAKPKEKPPHETGFGTFTLLKPFKKVRV